MYHCRIQFYFIGEKCNISDVIKEITPLEHFTHEFSESGIVVEKLAADADVIFVNAQGADVKKILQELSGCKKTEAQVILLADKGEFAGLEDELQELSDVWLLPMSDKEAGFRFLRWQQTYKQSKDFWETSQYLESTIDHIPNLVWYKDKDGIHEKVNDSFCKTVNKTKEQIAGQGHAYIWDVEQDDPACIESEREVMTKKKTFVSEETIKAGEGMRMLTTYKSPLYDLDGSVMGTVGVAIDVTQERMYEKELLSKNQSLETIFSTIDCGMMRHSLNGDRIISINRAALKILGYESQEELKAAGFDLIADSVVAEDKERLRECIRTLKKEGDNVSVEYRVKHKNGDILHVMGNVKMMQENGELIYQRFLLDCTEQKRQEKKRERRHTELVRALSIDYSLVCFIDLHTGTSITIQNNDNEQDLNAIFSGETVFEESMERYIREFVHDEDKEMLRKAVSLETLTTELSQKPIYYVTYRTSANDKMTYFQLKAVHAGHDEEDCGIVLGLRSVDEETRKEIEQKDLLQDALLQANRASKAKSVFLSNMSHDIRTPMNAIVGFTNLAITHIDNTEQVEEYLRKISTSGNHLLSLINDVLDMSHIESGKIQLEEKQCSLPEILQGLRNILQADINAKQLELQIETVDIRDEDIYCDKLRLNQVLLNLLSNSVKYTRAGGKVSMCITEKCGAPDGYATYEFVIKDTGIGMSEEFVKRIFEPFERERTAKTSGIQGTGLGMAITKNIVDLMNGAIDVESELGVGTKFTVSFTFRLHTGAKEAQEIPERKEGCTLVADGDADKEKAARHTGRILLAEDVDLNQEIAVAILGDAGFSTEVADNGQIAVDMLKKSEPGYYKLVLMDVQMPVMNGYEATKLIRAFDNKELASIPIIAMTANAFEEDKKEALQCGMNGHIAKPIDINILLKTLDKILN